MGHILEIEALSKSFNGAYVLNNLSLGVDKGDVLLILGPNGAGKTTLLHIITGFLSPDRGDVRFQGRSLIGLSPDRIAGLGISRTFQEIRVISKLTVLENALLAVQNHPGEKLRKIVFGRRRWFKEEQAHRERVRTLLESLGLGHKLQALGEQLSYGEKKLVGLARCFASDPKVLLLDEPISGLHSDVIGNVLDLIKKFSQGRKAVIAIEHDIGPLMDIVDAIVVLDRGRRLSYGPPEETMESREVGEILLGRDGGPVMILRVQDLVVSYDGRPVLNSISFDVAHGEIVALLGKNGSGKSTALKGVFGLLKAEGRVIFEGKAIENRKPFLNIQDGLSFVPQDDNVFPHLSVRENLELGAYTLTDKEEVRARIEDVFQLFPELRLRVKQRAGSLSGGERQMLALGVGLMTSPKVMLLDEPSIGLSPKLVQKVFRKIKSLKDRGMAFVIAEQRIREAMDICDRSYVLKEGRIFPATAEALTSSAYVSGYVSGGRKDDI